MFFCIENFQLPVQFNFFNSIQFNSTVVNICFIQQLDFMEIIFQKVEVNKIQKIFHII